MSIELSESSLSKNISSSGAIKTAPGRVRGVVINSHTSGTLKLWDNATAGSGTILFNTISFAVGEHYINLFNCQFVNGLFATIGGTADVTILYV